MAPACTEVADSTSNGTDVEVDASTEPASRTDEPDTEKNCSAEIEAPFSIYSTAEKKWISFLASFGAMFSTLSSYIYFPALVPMATDLNVSLSLINLTVTSYLIMSGIAPAFMGDIADQAGRRPAYILMFALVLGSNIGIALQKSYSALLVLRIIQSAGASGSYGAAYGVVADITTTLERGSYIGSLLLLANGAPSFGPVIAGVLTQKLGWRWIFWFLVILTGTYLVFVLFLLPETQRKIVGNGSVRAGGVHRSMFDIFTRDRKTMDDQRREISGKRRYHIPNPFKCILMLRSKGNLAVISVGSITYVVKMTLQASLAAQCIRVYNLDYLQAGLIYLPSGVGGAIASYVTGKVMDRNIKSFAARNGRDAQNWRGNDISGFPIEEARLVGIHTLVILSAAGTAGYGVSLMKRTHIAVPLVAQFISGAATSSIFTICGTLLTDLNPNVSATVQASYNLVRCLGTGAAIASQQPLTDAIGLGWCFGFFALMMLSAAPLALVLTRYGPSWRRQNSA